MRFLAAGIAAICVIGSLTSGVQEAAVRSTSANLYDADPGNLWNRIHQCFHVRVAPDGSEYGFDTVDPLLWRETKYLLTQPSHGRALTLLDEFLSSNAERLVDDPVKRAVFQHDLWAVFDWLISTSERDKAARAALMQQVARVMRRVALPRKTIDMLPDNYAAADGLDGLPRDLFSASGPWVSIGGTQPIAKQHAGELGRSAFIVLWNLPGGRAATLAHLRKLWDFPQPFIRDESFPNDGEVRVKLNPALPSVPDGTRLALVRMMLLVDDAGVIAPSKLVQGIQLREMSGRQTFSELKMSRVDLFAGKSGGLRAVGADDREFLTFSSHGIDPFEHEFKPGAARSGRVLDMCRACHQSEFRPANETIQSLRQILRPNVFVDISHERWARWFRQPVVAAEAKNRTYEWGVLQGLWLSEPR